MLREIYKNQICSLLPRIFLEMKEGMKKTTYDVKLRKQRIREYIWDLMEKRGVARFPRPIRGRIPNFIGAEIAASRLTKHKIFLDADIVFSCPDSPQRPVREAVLKLGKTLVMASPRLRSGFIILNPGKIPRGMERKASTIRGAFMYGEVKDIPPAIDIKVTGSVAVSIDGGRVGKGGGYSDLEYAIMRELGLIDEDTPVITTVHDLQIINDIPMTEHDVPVDYIFTPTREIKTKGVYKKPQGIILEELDPRKVNEIPILRKILSQ